MIERGKSIRSKLIRLVLIISSLSLLIVFFILFIYEVISFRQSTGKQLEVLGSMLARNSTAAIAFDDVEDARQILASVEAERNIQMAVLFDDQNKVFARMITPGTKDTVFQQPLEDGLIMGIRYFELATPVVQNEKRLGTLYLRRGIQDMNNTLTLYTMVLLTVLTISALLTWLLSRRLEKSISEPIIALASTAELVSQRQDYSVRAQLAGEGEIQTLTTAFNHMLSRIDSQNQEIQRHAHELEKKVAERTLEIKRQKDFAETVINSSLILIAVFDTETRFIGFNKTCEIEFGRKREDVLGKRYAEAMPNAVGSPAYKAVLRALNGEVAHYESYRSPVSGEFYEAFGIPIKDEKNEVYAALLTAHNITATITATEKLVISNNELKKKNAELEQFAYVASHDLQEPLRKIQTFADRTKRSSSIEAAALYLQKIETSAERMSRLIRDVLEYSKLSKLEEAFTATDLNQILDYVKSDFELLIFERSVKIESDKLPIVIGHHLQLHQLFANLINNAIKFCERQPHIRITVEPVTAEELLTVHLDADGEHCKLTFTDNGVGFDPAFKDKIFTIFQRLHTREKYEGTGIGLALCKKIVDNHRGHISVESKVNSGTTFTIILPIGL